MIVRPRPHGIRLFFALRGSILPSVAPALLVCMGWAAVVTMVQGRVGIWAINLTPMPFTLMGLALAIFLGFRNGAAYERYWEGRKLWGDLVHRARSLSRQLTSFMPPNDESASAVQLERSTQIRRVIAFCHALRHQLRDSDPLQDVSEWLSPSEAKQFAAHRRGTEYLLRRIGDGVGASVRSGALDARLAAEMDGTLSAMSAVAAGCERIRSTPIPFPYTLLLHRTSSVYCLLLPFGLIAVAGPMTPILVGVVAYTFFGLDAVSDAIEAPFGTSPHHLPLAAICRTIEIDLMEAMGQSMLPEPMEPTNAVLL